MTLTNQEIFDKALFGIRSQNYQQSLKVFGKFKNYACAYRGENGTKCAVGHCISDKDANLWDSLYSSAGSAIDDIFTLNETKGSYFKYFTEDQLEFLQKLQHIHDTQLSGSGNFELGMHELASEYQLNYKEI